MVNSAQSDALDYIYGVGFDEITSHKYYALVENTQKDQKRTEAELKFASVKPNDINNFIVSDGLARALEGDSNTQVRILEVYLKPQDIDLDKI